MQFSIFGMPFKCTKDIFVWEKIKWTTCIYWAQLWRGVVFSVAALPLCFGIMLIPAFANSDALAQFNNAEFGIRVAMHIAYSLHYWYQQMFVPSIVLLCLGCCGLILGAIYIQYYAMFKKNYQSFSCQFNKPEVRSFWSSGFWKPFVLTTVFGWLIGFVVGFIFGLLNIQQIVITLISVIIGVVFFHIFLHGGTWGFMPISKKMIDATLEVKI